MYPIGCCGESGVSFIIKDIEVVTLLTLEALWLAKSVSQGEDNQQSSGASMW